ncbi:tetratricopeptide repeat protein [Ferroplasma sp.]|uniref:tetratricopeptide repeat protein n=1 Tax=Ferroplasma sp. TaxID=2591003 RepID=UPI00307F5AFC
MEDYEEFIKNGDSFVKKEKFMDAIREFVKAYDIITVEDDKAEIAYKLSQCYFSLDHKNIEDPLKYANISLEIHRKLENTDLEIMDMLNIGYIYLDSGKRDDALSYFEDAIARADSIKDAQLFALTNNARAEALSSLKSKQPEAMKIYDNVLELSEKTEDWENYFEALYGKLNILRDSDINAAFELGKSGLDKIDSIMNTLKTKKDKKEFKESVGYLYDSVSDIAMELENIDEAMKIAARSRE